MGKQWDWGFGQVLAALRLLTKGYVLTTGLQLANVAKV